MCGIAGAVTLVTLAQADVRATVEALRQFGPDHRDVGTRAGAALGHARLSIVDLRAAGEQQMVPADCLGTNEIVDYKMTGMLVGNAPDRLTSCAAALTNFMSESGLRDRLGRAGRTHASRLEAACDSVDEWEALLVSVHSGPNQADCGRPARKVPV
jgi:hypothetical protein